MIPLRAVMIPALCLSVAGCGAAGRVIGTDEAKAARALPYKARLSRSDDRREFTVSVAGRGAGVAEVRESVRFEATEYCIFGFGSSDAQWNIDPASGDWAFTQSGDRLIFAGRCTAR